MPAAGHCDAVAQHRQARLSRQTMGCDHHPARDSRGLKHGLPGEICNLYPPQAAGALLGNLFQERSQGRGKRSLGC